MKNLGTLADPRAQGPEGVAYLADQLADLREQLLAVQLVLQALRVGIVVALAGLFGLATWLVS